MKKKKSRGNQEECLRFSTLIEEIVNAEKGKISIMEAITEYCDSSGLEIESAAALLTASLKQKIATEARKVKAIKS